MLPGDRIEVIADIRRFGCPLHHRKGSVSVGYGNAQGAGILLDVLGNLVGAVDVSRPMGGVGVCSAGGISQICAVGFCSACSKQ